MWRTCSSITRSFRVVYSHIYKETTALVLWVIFSQHCASSSDWNIWQQLLANLWRMGKSKNRRRRLLPAYDNTSSKNRIAGIHFSNRWRTRTINKIIDPPVCPNSVWCCQEIHLKRQESTFRQRSLLIYPVMYHHAYFKNALKRDCLLWEKRLTVDRPRRKSNPYTTTTNAYVKKRYSRKSSQYLLTDNYLR